MTCTVISGKRQLHQHGMSNLISTFCNGKNGVTEMANFVIGIDLGTTNTCASIFVYDRVKLLENAEGELITPSFVFFADIEKEKVLVGPYAKKMADYKPEFGVYELKRFIGREFNDRTVQNNLQYYPFPVEEGLDKNCIIVFEQNGKTYERSIEEITSMLLQKVKTDVSTKMKSPVDKAVITVPAYFNHHQREATLKAAQKAGFTVLKLLNEPTAAALSYFQERQTSDSDGYYLVYDLGGGTFDVAILKKKQNDIEVVAVDGDSHLGGRDFDALITDYICDILLKEYNFNAKADKRTMKRLQTKSEETKKALSFAGESDIILEGFVPGQSVIIISLTRKYFESMAFRLFEKSIEILDMCLKSAKLQKDHIEEAILSGGSTRIPKIQEMISRFFNGMVLDHFVHPDLCVANGASIQAALLSTNSLQKIDTMQVREVTPLSLGSCNWVHEMKFIIKRNTPLPASREVTCCNADNQQESMIFRIFEGERSDARKNRLLGKFTISDLTPAPPGQCKITLTLEIDRNGILTATANEKYRDNVKEVKIAYTRGERGDVEIRNSMQDAENYKDDDAKFSQFARQKEHLLDYCTVCNYNIETMNLIDVKKSVYELCKNALMAAEKFEMRDQDQLQELIKEVKFKLEPLVRYYKFQLMP